MRKLTAKQKRYCKERAEGKGLADAYASAGYGQGTTRDGQRVNAFKLENESASADRIKREIERLQALADAGYIADRKQRQAILTEILTDKDEATADRLRASDQLNRMGGDYTDRVLTESAVKLSYSDRLEAMRQAQDGDSDT